MRNRFTPIPDSGIPNSEIRMAYGNPGIPHHEVGGPRGASWGAVGRIQVRGRGADTGCPMPIAGWDIGCPGGGSWLPSVKSKATSDQVTK